LFKTDGAVTTSVGTFPPGSSSGNAISNLTDDGQIFYFTGPDVSGNGVDLYASDGTRGGTVLLQDFQSKKSAYSYPAYYPVTSLTPAGSKLFFGVADAAHGPSLWATDGTVAGTTLVKSLSDASIATLNANRVPFSSPTAAGNKLFFTTVS